MILFSILVFVLLVILTVLALVFGDLFMCIGIIYGLVLIYKWIKQKVRRD